MLDMQAVIAARRDGRGHDREDLKQLALAAAQGTVPDYQLSAWLMAAYLHPLSIQETAWLTEAMAHSGEVMNLEGLPRPWVDKHSTGGVGDKTTIALLPILAACGLSVVKMSGRGLGIAGGTIDKLSAIPGMSTNLSPERMKEQARQIGLALTGQTPALAPADKALYALRDATATVESAPLIASSVLCKKIAGGAETIVLDVKCGSGAYMKTEESARELASMLRDIGKELGLNLHIAMTDMSQPLGSAVGNALEIREAIAVVKGDDLNPEAERFRHLCIELAGITLAASKLYPDEAMGKKAVTDCIRSGEASHKMRQWFAAQGAQEDIVDNPSLLPVAPICHQVCSDREGWTSKVDAELVGRGVVRLGGGRKRKEDSIDVSVGIEIHCHVGSQVGLGDPLFTIHAQDQSTAEKVAERVLKGIQIDDQPVEATPLILERF